MTIQKPKIILNKADLPHGIQIIDAFESALRELFFINHPNLKKTMPEAQVPLSEFIEAGDIEPVWVYYPHRNLAISTLPEDLYFKVRTSRNRDIISTEEQLNFRNLTVGIAGLSVGSAIVSSLNVSGGPKRMKIADFDEVELSNLNRIKAKLIDIHRNKAEVAAEEVWLLDPYADLHIFDKGINKDNLHDFILGDPKLDVFIDEMDSIDLKFEARFLCKENRIPVLMATDNGDSVILDVERFDLEPQREIFHGLVGEMHKEDLKNMDFKKWLQLATKIVGPEYLTERMQMSLLDIGKNIPAVPQLGTTANLAGAAMAFAVRMIANKMDLPSGRYAFGLEEKLVPNYNSAESVKNRAEQTANFIEQFKKRM